MTALSFAKLDDVKARQIDVIAILPRFSDLVFGMDTVRRRNRQHAKRISLPVGQRRPNGYDLSQLSANLDASATIGAMRCFGRV